MQPFSTSPQDARALGVYARVSALSWAACWGWGPGIVLDAAGHLGGKSRGLAKSCADAGLLRVQQWDASTHVRHIYLPTTQGTDFLHEHLDVANSFAQGVGYPMIAVPEKTPKFTRHIAVHDLFVQMLAVIALIDSKCGGRALSYTPGAQIRAAAGDKIPDCIIERASSTDYIEFEYSKKSGAEVQDFIDYYYRSLSLDPSKRLYVSFAGKSLQSPFARLWQPGHVVFAYGRNDKGQWVKRDIMGTPIECGPSDLRALFEVVSWAALLDRLGELGKLRPKVEAAPPERLW